MRVVAMWQVAVRIMTVWVSRCVAYAYAARGYAARGYAARADDGYADCGCVVGDCRRVWRVWRLPASRLAVPVWSMSMRWWHLPSNGGCRCD